MKVVVVVSLAILSILSIGAAIHGNVRGTEGWGWFLFVGLVFGLVAAQVGAPK